jgi:hypothetical protein
MHKKSAIEENQNALFKGVSLFFISYSTFQILMDECWLEMPELLPF